MDKTYLTKGSVYEIKPIVSFKLYKSTNLQKTWTNVWPDEDSTIDSSGDRPIYPYYYGIQNTIIGYYILHHIYYININICLYNN